MMNDLESKRITLESFLDQVKDYGTQGRQSKLCFVLGAGASKSSGIITGEEMVDLWESELKKRNPEIHQKWKSDLGIEESNKYNFYSQYFSRKYEQNKKEGYEFLRIKMENAKPGFGFTVLSHILTNTNNNVVISTNFDHLCEQAVSYFTQKFPLVIGHESLAGYIPPNPTRPVIIKIHRDLLLAPLTEDRETNQLHPDWKKALENIFRDYHPVFIGYAGNDKSLMGYLLDVADSFQKQDFSCPYWLVYGKQPPEGKIKEFLLKSNGYWANHDGFDQVLALWGDAVKYKFPTKNDFIKQFEERHQTLQNALEELIASRTQVSVITAAQEDPNHFKEADKPSDVIAALGRIVESNDTQREYVEWVSKMVSDEYDKALEIIQKLIETEPENARYLDSLGVTLHEMGRYDEALAQKQRAVQLEPDNARYLDSLGVTLHEMGRYDEALAQTQKAVQLEPDNARYLDSLGVTLHEMGRYDEALAQMQKAVQLEPDNALYNFTLGNVFHALKRHEEALTYARKALDLQPNNDQYIKLLSKLRKEMESFE